MKKILITYLSLLLLGSGAASAQRDLQSFPVFQGKVVPGRQMVTTEVRVGEELAGKVSALVEADAADADIRETEKTGHLLTYALVKPASKGKSNRYLCYQARPVGGEWKITLLYLEGPATLEDLRAMFEKQ